METLFHKPIEVSVGHGQYIRGELTIPESCEALVIFSHGSGSSRFSPRNRKVASDLHAQHFATLLIDLLTPEEDREYRNRFDIDLLAERLIRVTSFVAIEPELGSCPIGYFGASTGAASALKAAAKLGTMIEAVVSRGGRPDLAEEALVKVNAPVLLIVGSLDPDVITLNRKAFALLPGERELVIVEGASHLFEEEGKLDEVAHLAGDWFTKFLAAHPITAH